MSLLFKKQLFKPLALLIIIITAVSCSVSDSNSDGSGSISGSNPTILRTWSALGGAEFTGPAIYLPSIDVSSSGNVYIAYSDYVTREGKSMMFDGSAWQTLSANFSTSRIYFPVVRLANNGTPYVAYVENDQNNEISVKSYDGTSWSYVGGVGAVSEQASFIPSFEIANNGTLYFAYTDIPNGNKSSVMTYDGTDWVNVGSAGFGNTVYYFPDLAIANNGTLYVVYSDADNGNKATVMTYNTGANTWDLVGSAGLTTGEIWLPSIAVANNGTPYIAFMETSDDNKVTAMKYEGGAWVTVGTASFTPGAGFLPDLVFSDDNEPYIAYAETAAIITTNEEALIETNTNYGMVVSSFDGTEWQVVGDSSLIPGSGYYATLTFNGNDAYIAYTDTNSSNITVMAYK